MNIIQEKKQKTYLSGDFTGFQGINRYFKGNLYYSLIFKNIWDEFRKFKYSELKNNIEGNDLFILLNQEFISKDNGIHKNTIKRSFKELYNLNILKSRDSNEFKRLKEYSLNWNKLIEMSQSDIPFKLPSIITDDEKIKYINYCDMVRINKNNDSFDDSSETTSDTVSTSTTTRIEKNGTPVEKKEKQVKNIFGNNVEKLCVELSLPKEKIIEEYRLCQKTVAGQTDNSNITIDQHDKIYQMVFDNNKKSKINTTLELYNFTENKMNQIKSFASQVQSEKGDIINNILNSISIPLTEKRISCFADFSSRTKNIIIEKLENEINNMIELQKINTTRYNNLSSDKKEKMNVKLNEFKSSFENVFFSPSTISGILNDVENEIIYEF